MRFFFMGPRILGIRPGVSFGPSDFRKAFGAKRGATGNMTGSFVYVIADESGRHKYPSAVIVHTAAAALLMRSPRGPSHDGHKDAFDLWWEWVEKPLDSPLTIDADRWDDDVRLSDLEPRFSCNACGRRGADVRPLFEPAPMGTSG
jgi:hypothetical protein